MNHDPHPAQLREAIRSKYRKVAHTADGLFKYPTGREGALLLGYAPEILDEVPAGSLRCFCGVGNPLSLGAAETGERVLDLGCGAGVDLYVAAGMVGRRGRVEGLDLTREIVSRARDLLKLVGIDHASVLAGCMEWLPYADRSFDVVISNGVINLSPDKSRVWSEIARVLRPGGRAQIADMALDEELPEEVIGNLDAWSE